MFRRHVRARIRLYSAITRRFVLHNLLHADDPPERLARGVAIGLFVAFTPTIGFQMGLVLFLAWLFRANKLIGLPMVWISNPVTLVPIYYPCYKLGVMLTRMTPVNAKWWSDLAHPPEGWWNTVDFYWTQMVDVAVPMWVGCVVVGLLFALPSYIIVHRTICYYRIKRWGQLIPPSASKPHKREAA
ncbi:MAG: DUF2062 domain-containing protein [Planctomycetes bacterium]|nr:DUF2062 domain-containing protein [Planctomycetota bacterium]